MERGSPVRELFDTVPFAGEPPMRMRIRQPRQHRRPLEIDHPRPGRRLRLRLCRRSDKGDLSIRRDDRLGAWRHIVGRVNAGIGEHECLGACRV